MAAGARPAAVIVCGGQSRRMGRSKAWLPFGAEPLLGRVARILGSACDPLVVVAAAGQDLPDLPATVPVVRDPVADQGPLRGLATGLAALPATVDLVFASATDVAFLRPAWIGRLVELIGDGDYVIPEVGGRFHPLAALYRRGPTLRAAEALLAADRRRLVGLRDILRGRVADAASLADADPGFATVRNLNTPDEYRRALGDAGLAAGESA